MSELNAEQLELVKRIRSGNAISEFLGTEIAKIVFSRIEEMREQEVAKLVEASPFDSNLILQIQMRIQAMDIVPSILQETLSDANGALTESQEQFD